MMFGFGKYTRTFGLFEDIIADLNESAETKTGWIMPTRCVTYTSIPSRHNQLQIN